MCGAKYCIKGEFIDEVDVDDVVVALVDLARAVSYEIQMSLSVTHYNFFFFPFAHISVLQNSFQLLYDFY